ncbi:hypothetical protein GF337_01115 [candidate division KSB1 bacterium]|nr:hypothetical protein [candidate division KSB1 bacterium]
MNRIGFGKRFIAAIFDVIILVLLLHLLSWILGNDIMRSPVDLKGGIQAFQFSHLLVVLLYFTLEIFLAATPGKLALRLKIKNESNQAASAQALLIRYLIKHSGNIFTLLFILTQVRIFWFLSTIIGFIVFIGCFMVFTASRQALHDKIAKTAVYQS